MTDQPDDQPDDQPGPTPPGPTPPGAELTPAQEQRVRRALADARHREPMPADVAARMQDVLAGLASGPAVAGEPADAENEPAAPVVDLAARRRRRRVTQLLVAAVAVTVVGVAGPQLLNGAGDLMGATSSSDSDAGGAGDGQAESAPEAAAGGAEDDSGTDNSARGPEPERSGSASARVLLPVDEDAFLRTAARLQPDAEAVSDASDALTYLADSPAPDSCPGQADWGAGLGVPVRYDGLEGVLVFRVPDEDGQRVDLFLCGQATPTRTVVLPLD